MSEWIELAKTEDCPPGEAVELVAGDRIVALYNVDGQFYALDGVCPHQGGPLGKGTLTGCIVICPWHGWQYNVQDGQHQTNKAIRHLSFPIKVEQEVIYVQLTSETTA